MQQDSLVAGLRRHIRKSTKPVTILLTDIEGSTEYFEKHGDIEGRLMVDQHNRLVFPVIARFRGKIIKTTGDGVMASFRVAGTTASTTRSLRPEGTNRATYRRGHRRRRRRLW